MNLSRCEKGHFYDKEKFPTCPHCNPHYSLKPEVQLNKKYTIIETIGHGATSIVYKATDSKGHIFAIKELFLRENLRSSTSNDIVVYNDDDFQIAKKHRISEIEKYKLLNETNATPKIYDIFEENNTIYCVMDYLTGYSLGALLHEFEQKFDHDLKMNIIYCVLYNLKKVHDKNILILDIAPNNIFIKADGNIVFCDLGNMYVEKNDTEKKYEASITVSTKFAPPELYNARKEIGTYSDVYAIASVIYTILFEIEPTDSITRLISSKDIFEFNDIEYNIKNALQHALELNIRSRTQTIDIFIAELFGYNPNTLPTPKHKSISSFIRPFTTDNKKFKFSSSTQPSIMPSATSSFNSSNSTSIFYEIGIDPDDVEKVDISEIPKETQSYKMLMNQFKAVSQKYDESCSKVTELEKKLEDKKNSTVMMTIGEIVLSLGTIFIHDLSPQSIITVLAGILITVYALYLNFRDKA
ncbi:MAG: protein kinase [Roseburia sp.]|nr:protein kinase [Roseburia sp.]